MGTMDWASAHHENSLFPQAAEEVILDDPLHNASDAFQFERNSFQDASNIFARSESRALPERINTGFRPQTLSSNNPFNIDRQQPQQASTLYGMAAEPESESWMGDRNSVVSPTPSELSYNPDADRFGGYMSFLNTPSMSNSTHGRNIIRSQTAMASFGMKADFSQGTQLEDISETGLSISRQPAATPSTRSNSPILRRDQVRKKNARFEIPEGRNLHTIDLLISQCKDEKELKELKAQKRLLRNRQAALDSRQRKKQHTERLEQEREMFNTTIHDLEQKCTQLELECKDYLETKEKFERLMALCEEQRRQIDIFTLEKEELVREHTIETGNMRKQISVLVEVNKSLESSAMNAPGPSSSYAGEFEDNFSSLMDENFWSNESYIHNYMDEQQPAVKQEKQTHAVAKRSDKIGINDEDKPAANGLLLMLLLFGAFVASRNNSSSSSVALPKMPEDIRAASATVLDNIFKDAGVPSSNSVEPLMNLNPTRSSLDNVWPPVSKTTISSRELIEMSSPTFPSPSASFFAPTRQQEAEQIFSLSPFSLNSITNNDYMRPDVDKNLFTSVGRQNIQESLATLRKSSTGKEGAADVYTRSLLMNKASSDVVREFAEFVGMVQRQNGEQQQQQQAATT